MGNRIVLLAIFALLSIVAYGQNVPSGAIWGNSKIPLRTAANDTAGYADLTSLKSFFTGGLGSGTVTTVSVASANGFAGSVATATTTPVITITATPTGVLKSNGTALSAATAGTDYSAGTSALGTGILKSTTTTGALTIATAGDFPTLNQNTTGNAATVTTNANLTGVVTSVGNATSIGTGAITNTMVASIDAATKLTGIAPVANGGSGVGTLTGHLKGNGTSAFTASPTIPLSDITGATLQAITTNGATSSVATTYSGGLTSSGITTTSGGYVDGVSSVSSTTTLTTAANLVKADATSAAFTITLPTTPANGTRIRVIKTNATANYVTLSKGGANTINGNNTFVIVSNNMPVTLYFDTATWYVE